MSERWFPDEMPTPAASAETVGWWEAAADHRLVVQRCTACGTTRHPPGPLCPTCRSFASEWMPLPGTGTVYTYTVVHQAFIPALGDTVPYVVVAVELDGAGGARLVSDLVDTDPSDVAVGMPVEVAWEDMGPELALPRFRRAAVPGAGPGGRR
ncbi:MAG TPA: Zn-ribbon domain-containing OB-fold protein [Acidimicrobiales bacterium]|nr:Zn-ribbon domain-containing OB-fold protein [Acidimicrobiales bacterium]